MSQASQLEVENKLLSMKVDEMKQVCTVTSTMNVKYRMQLETETAEKENLQESNHKLKVKLNSLTVVCNELNHKIKVLETELTRHNATRIVAQPQVRVIKSIADIIESNPNDSAALDDLQKRFDELDAEHQEALNVIDELEFELGDVIARGHCLTVLLSLSFPLTLRITRSITLKWRLKGFRRRTKS